MEAGQFIGDVTEQGYALNVCAVEAPMLAALENELSQGAAGDAGHYSRAGVLYGRRNLLQFGSAAFAIASHASLHDVACAMLCGNAVAVKATFFDKNEQANWHLSWHQDLFIAVARKVAVTGFSAWSQKEGVWHTQPPVEILQHMVALRVHLDDCDADNGALQILPSTHQFGKLSSEEILRHLHTKHSVVCNAQRGTVMAMRPLVLHCSKKVKSHHRQRRVLHIEYAAGALPGGLQWSTCGR